MVEFIREHPEDGVLVKNDVVGSVCSKYMEQAGQIVEEVKKSEAALRRFRRNKESIGDSTCDSLIKQFSLDVQELGDCINAIGVDLNEIDQFVTLSNMF